MEQFWLTTIDNPFNYFTHPDEWHQFDDEKRYNTCGYIAREAERLGYSSEMSETRKTETINQAVDNLYSSNLLGIYRKITKNSTITPVKLIDISDQPA